MFDPRIFVRRTCTRWINKTGHSPPSDFSIQLDEDAGSFLCNALLAAQELAQISVQLLAGFSIPLERPRTGFGDADPIGESKVQSERGETARSIQ